MLLRNFVHELEELIPLSLQESYDNCGLILGNPNQEIKAGLVCLDITESILQEAVDLGANLIISHHPLIFKGIKNLIADEESQRLVISCIENQMAVYAIHTNLDSIFGGVSFQIGDLLGLKNLEFLNLRSGKPPQEIMDDRLKGLSIVDSRYSGLGVIGNYGPPISWGQFSKILMEKFKIQVLRHSAPRANLISRVGLCGGSGGEFLNLALDKACDVYLTADLKYHQFFLEKNNFILVDMGHYESEQFSPELIAKIISKKFPTFALSLTKLNTNPIYYSY
jgi:dinuclear metal center YbgI/SA1388 family protein